MSARINRIIPNALFMHGETSTLTQLSRRLFAYICSHGLVWLAITLLATSYALFNYQSVMTPYDVVILLGVFAALSYAGLRWVPLRWLIYLVSIVSLCGIYLYAGELSRGQEQFWLSYLLASQSAIMWMSVLFIMATLAYFAHIVTASKLLGQTASILTWSAVAMGLVGLLIRWHESYLLGADIGHIPISNLYEVFVLFCVITGLLYLYYEARFNTRMLGVFVLFIISAAVSFIIWYSISREAHHIQPLVPALRSYWMKIHVPANFIGYGGFSIAAMFGIAYLLQDWMGRRPFWQQIRARLPAAELLEDMMYKAIALGFAFFTLATILGSLWAAEAWGGYWSWDPKETWALIVWLNYAAWLHMHIHNGWRGKAMAYWSVIGLFITLFAFMGVNMFLSGLHSYGEL